MRFWTQRVAILLALLVMPLTLSASYRSCEQLHVVKHFHAGPEGGDDECGCGYIYAEDVDCCNHPYNGHWNQVCSDPCCAYWHCRQQRCPNYDDSDNEYYYDNVTHWPSKNETSWMHELDPW